MVSLSPVARQSKALVGFTIFAITSYSLASLYVPENTPKQIKKST